jgi:membrane-bound lytic murein transglycosylase MltF
MVNAGLIPTIVVDDYLAVFWSKVFPNLLVHENVALQTGGSLGIAVRKNNPQLLAALNTFMGKYGLGSAFGNQVQRKYLVDRPTCRAPRLRKGAETFLAGRGAVSEVQRQVQAGLPAYGRSGFAESGSIRTPEPGRSYRHHANHAGDRRVTESRRHPLLEPNIMPASNTCRSVRDTYAENEPMDDLNKGLFTFASYNAGPGRVSQLRREAEKRGLNPNVWFGNVEQIASERIGRETVTYVSNIFKYYIAYRLVEEENARREAAKATVKAQ